MCLSCRNCATEHTYSLDNAIDAVDASPAKSYIRQ